MLSFFKRIEIAPSQILRNKKIHIIIVAIIIIILYQLIAVYYTVINYSENPIPVLYEGYDGIDEITNDSIKMIEEVKKLKLFSKVHIDNELNNTAYVAEDISNYPIYSGGIRLVGVLEHTDEAKSIAVLEFEGRQASHFIHDEIGDGITIVKILKDKIIINEKKLNYSLILR
ncbi:type II secretion system protein N [Yersinia aleksiciae]|uniref:General secretion pathway protein C n=1 Tax=Yersinia aleksiciae TaxID=263819 RepID=A0A0T9TY62_YERAE|nr:type II secretion system protein N [Yersinia aleksiciae]CNL08296.1 general secretion pathway protein C [Yersinia aleksiciae]